MRLISDSRVSLPHRQGTTVSNPYKIKRQPSKAPWRPSLSLLRNKNFKIRSRYIHPTGLTNLVFPLQLKQHLWRSHASPLHSVRRYTLYKTLLELPRDVLKEKGKFHDVNNPERNVNRQNEILMSAGVINNRSHSAVQQLRFT